MMRLFGWLLFCRDCYSQIRKIVTCHFSESSFEFLCCLINPRIWRIIYFTIVPNKLQVIANGFNCWIFTLIEFFIDSGKIHRIFYYLWIISQAHAFPVNWLSKVMGVAMVEKGLKYNFDFLLILFLYWRWRFEIEWRKHLILNFLKQI